VQECYCQVMVEEECLLSGTGSQVEEKEEYQKEKRDLTYSSN